MRQVLSFFFFVRKQITFNGTCNELDCEYNVLLCYKFNVTKSKCKLKWNLCKQNYVESYIKCNRIF